MTRLFSYLLPFLIKNPPNARSTLDVAWRETLSPPPRGFGVIDEVGGNYYGRRLKAVALKYDRKAPNRITPLTQGRVCTPSRITLCLAAVREIDLSFELFCRGLDRAVTAMLSLITPPAYSLYVE